MDPLLNNLSAQGGVLGTLVAILLGLCFLLVKLLLAEKDKRIEDANGYRDNIAEPLRRVADSQERIEGKILVAKGER